MVALLQWTLSFSINFYPPLLFAPPISHITKYYFPHPAVFGGISNPLSPSTAKARMLLLGMQGTDMKWAIFCASPEIYCSHCFGRKDSIHTIYNLKLKYISGKEKKDNIYNLSFDLTCFSVFPMQLHVSCFELSGFARRIKDIFHWYYFSF